MLQNASIGRPAFAASLCVTALLAFAALPSAATPRTHDDNVTPALRRAPPGTPPVVGPPNERLRSFAAERVFYLGALGDTRLHDAYPLSDGSLLLAGEAANLDWVPAGVPRVALAPGGIASAAAGRIGFIAQVSGDLARVRAVAHFPQGTVRSVARIRGSEVPGAPTGALFVSGHRDNVANDGYYLARLDRNFVDGLPTALVWARNVDTRGNGDGANSHKALQPWDVGGDGKVVYAEGAAFAGSWAAIHRLDDSGEREVVPQWRAHWLASGGEWHGAPATAAPGPLSYSGIVMKSRRVGQLRSADAFEQAWETADENGNGGRRGRWPDDYYFTHHCAYAACDNTQPGYTGYRIGSNDTQRVGAIVVDRRDNGIYFGYSTQSRLPGGNPDFEPAVVAMDAQGALRWWARLYRETSANSPPDQYVDGLALDYAGDRLVVLARSHGNNTVNFWSGNAITANPAAGGWQNRFSGTNGNIHVSWLGKYAVGDGRLQHATWVGEFNEGAAGGAPHPDPIMGGWPNPNAGWPDLNTTRCRSALSVARDGAVVVACTGRRTATTINAYQRMPLPGQGVGTWNDFVRVYRPDLSGLRYSSLLTGDWNRSNGSGGDNTTLAAAVALDGRVLVVGHHRKDAATGLPRGVPMPTLDVPAWGSASPTGESALLGVLRTGDRGNEGPCQRRRCP